ncbi:MAG TPA: zinc-ribbon domain-containing protein [Clostridia bacterium]|nr:zinc-ribbon domain-containing protein [Clostridia bacterium]
MFCENCGNQIPDTAAFCTKCGAKTGGAQTGASINQPMPSGQPAQPDPYKAAPVQTGSVRVGPVPPVTRPAPNVPPTTGKSGPEIPPAPAQPAQPHVATPVRPTQSHFAAPGQPAQSHAAAPGQPARPYGATPGQTGSGSVGSDIMSYGQYVVMMLLTGIPIVNIVLLIKWGFLDEVSPNKRNFSRAMLTFMAIAFVFGIFMWGSITKMATRRYY